MRTLAIVFLVASMATAQQPGPPPGVLQPGGVEQPGPPPGVLQPGGVEQLPAGDGLDVLKARCLSCHDADMITAQKLLYMGWSRSIDKMVRWGTSITPEERVVLQGYLARHFAPRPVVSHDSTEAGETTYKRVCLSCHEADIIEQQKLTPTGWTRSVEKMMRWGAAVSDAEKQPLVEYLAARFGPP